MLLRRGGQGANSTTERTQDKEIKSQGPLQPQVRKRATYPRLGKKGGKKRCAATCGTSLLGCKPAPMTSNGQHWQKLTRRDVCTCANVKVSGKRTLRGREARGPRLFKIRLPCGHMPRKGTDERRTGAKISSALFLKSFHPVVMLKSIWPAQTFTHICKPDDLVFAPE